MPKKINRPISGSRPGRKNVYPTKVRKAFEHGPGNNRNTDIDATRMNNTSPGVPNSPEAVNLMFKGRIPMSNRINGLVLDEQQFLSKEELRETVEECLSKLQPRELLFANGILTGKTAAQAYLSAGYKADSDVDHKTKLERARKDATNLRKRDHVAEYISAVLRLNHLEAMEEVGFTHVEWLEKQREVLEMSLGQKKIKKTFILEGKPVETEVEDACLGVANKSLETLAKHYGWLNEKLQVEGAGLGPTVVLKDYTGAKNRDETEGDDE